MSEQEVNITLADISLVVNIIDICSKRGAFEGNELVTVGQLRDKLDTFVKANTPEEETKEETTTSE